MARLAKRTTVLRFRATPQEREQLEKIAKLRGTTMSNVLSSFVMGVELPRNEKSATPSLEATRSAFAV